jgi:hypothetical protein
MKKILIILFLIFCFYYIYKTYTKPPAPISEDQADLILFWGDGCPHCKIVEDYISTNKVLEKIPISQKEVYYNKSNQILLQDTVKKCPEIDASKGIGVPLAYSKSDNKCLYGDTSIIDWLKAKMLK